MRLIVSPYIHIENARVIAHRQYGGEQYILKLYMPKCAAEAKPGQFIYIQCSEQLPMRRPYSIMDVSVTEGWVELLYQVVGEGSRQLAERQSGDFLSAMGPIGRGFAPHRERNKVLLLGGGVGMPPILFLARHLMQDELHWDILVLLASEREFPFDVCLDDSALKGFSERGTLASLKADNISARLCSEQGYPDCFKGRIDKAADNWLSNLLPEDLRQIEVFACGPSGMLKSIAQLARRYRLPCQLCLEEYMACGVGGCAGCAVETVRDGKVTMKRVCVDGPVFNAEDIRFQNG